MFQNWKATPRSRAERAVIPQKSRLPSARSQNASSKTRSTWMVGARLELRVRARVGLRVRATATATARVRVRARVRSTLLSVPKPSRWMACSLRGGRGGSKTGQLSALSTPSGSEQIATSACEIGEIV